jgi:hypothetical protein
LDPVKQAGNGGVREGQEMANSVGLFPSSYPQNETHYSMGIQSIEHITINNENIY